MAYFGEGAKPFSHKNLKINNKRYYSENYTMTLLDHEKVKRKYVSEGENLSKVLEDGKIDTLPLTSYHERSLMLV